MTSLDQFFMLISYLNSVWGGCSCVAGDFSMKVQVLFFDVLGCSERMVSNTLDTGRLILLEFVH